MGLLLSAPLLAPLCASDTSGSAISQPGDEILTPQSDIWSSRSETETRPLFPSREKKETPDPITSPALKSPATMPVRHTVADPRDPVHPSPASPPLSKASPTSDPSSATATEDAPETGEVLYYSHNQWLLILSFTIGLAAVGFCVSHFSRHATFRVRISANISFFAINILALVIFSYHTFSQASSQLNTLTSDDLPILGNLTATQSRITKQNLTLIKYRYNPSENYANQFLDIGKEADHLLNQTQTIFPRAIDNTGESRQRNFLTRTRQDTETLDSHYANYQQTALAFFDAVSQQRATEAEKLFNFLDQQNRQIENDFERILDEVNLYARSNARSVQNNSAEAKGVTLAVAVVSLLLGCTYSFIIIRNLTKFLASLIDQLSCGSDQTSAAAAEVSRAGQSLAEGAGEQAASVQETSASLEELSSMTNANAENASNARNLARSTLQSAETGAARMDEMNSAMQVIQESSGNIEAIIKEIDEIAFQTNILALNAAVEAARAGEAGQGFAVVADEVRSLAQRSAIAAKETASQIQENVKRTEQGVALHMQVKQSLDEILEHVRQVDHMMNEISASSIEQSQGFGQINNAIAEIDKISQQNAASAEQSASAAEELNSQAETLKMAVHELERLAGTTRKEKSPSLPGPDPGNPYQTSEAFYPPQREHSQHNNAEHLGLRHPQRPNIPMH